jgi:hypothetical protein
LEGNFLGNKGFDTLSLATVSQLAGSNVETLFFICSDLLQIFVLARHYVLYSFCLISTYNGLFLTDASKSSAGKIRSSKAFSDSEL